jgi:hypothetical protein
LIELMLNKLHVCFCGGLLSSTLLIGSAAAAFPQPQQQEVHCDLLIIGGGVAGVAAAYEALKAGRVVCLTDITDWLGGQATSEGVSALDEELDRPHPLVFPKGYLEFRQRITDHYGTLNPGRCWVSDVCFLPRDGDRILLAMLQDAARAGNGTLRWFPNTVIQDLKIAALARQPSAQLIQSAIGIQHKAALDAPPLNTYPLSQTLPESYRDRHSALFRKTVMRFIPPASGQWYVLEASETGEVLALADIPYRVGIDPRTERNPSASSTVGDAYCTQGFTYSFAVEATKMPQRYSRPTFYPRYAAYYSYGVKRLASLPLVFTYRRIWSANRDTPEHVVTAGDISLQNWTWGNDYRPGTAKDNLIYTRQQLLETGQLQPGSWRGGLRISSLQQAEQLASGYFYWLSAGTIDSQLGSGVKHPDPHLRYLNGWKSPMGTAHGLSKYPYIREGRRLLGRPSRAYPHGFSIDEIDISRQDYGQPFYQQALSPIAYAALKRSLKQLGETEMQRTQSTRYPDSVGVGHYPIDIHPCMALSPPERPGNYEHPGETQGRGNTYPFQIPLRAMIPQRINNLLVTGKNIATSHISAAAYRTQPVEWSAGAAAGTTAVFALEKNIWPYQLVENVLFKPNLSALQQRLRANGHPTDIPRHPSWWLLGLGCIGLGGSVFLIWKRLQPHNNTSSTRITHKSSP